MPRILENAGKIVRMSGRWCKRGEGLKEAGSSIRCGDPELSEPF